MYCSKCGTKIKKYCRCEYNNWLYNKRMTFFEAWQKAEEGDVLRNSTLSFSQYYVEKRDNMPLVWADGKNITQLHLFEKEWSILPKRKKVEIKIPDGATNVEWFQKSGEEFMYGDISGVKKITYEIDGDD